MNNPEPALVTLSKLGGHLDARLAAAERAYGEASAEVAGAALVAEAAGDEAALRRLAGAERRRDKLAEDLERLRLARAELERQLAAQRESDEAAERRALVSQYIEYSDKVQDANRAMLEHIESMKGLTETAREHSRLAGRLAIRLGFPSDESSGAPLGRQQGYIKTAVNGIMANQSALVETARRAIMRDWRQTRNGRRVLELQTALGTDTTDTE